MNKKVNEIETIDLFLDDLIRDPNATSLAPEEIDLETVKLLRQVVLAEQGQIQDVIYETETKARVWQRVISNVQEAPESKNRTINRKLQLTHLLHQNWQRVALVATIILAALALSLYALISRPLPVRAQEIIEKAYAAANLPSNGVVQSFILTEIQHAVPANPRLNAQSGLKGDEQILNETKRWYEAPNQWRVEFQQEILAADGKEISHYKSVEVSDGTNIWHYDPGQNTVFVNPFNPAIDGKGGVALFGQNVGILDDLLQQATTCYNPKVTASDYVAGRATYVIDFGPTKCPSASAPEMNGRLVMWVDKETFFILKQELYNAEGNQVIMSIEVTQVQYNVPIDPGLFTFTPPARANTTDNRPKPTPSADEYQKQLEQLAQQVDFPIFVPDYLPQGLEPRQPRLNQMGGNSVELSYVPTEEVETDTSAETNGIVIQQLKADNSLVALWTEGAEPAAIPGGQSWLRRGIHNPDGTGSNSAALLLRDGTLVSIWSFTITPDELIKIAGSLNPAPGSHAPLPNPTPPTLDEIRGRVSFSVFIPTSLPQGLAPGSLSEGELTTENVEIKYIYPDGAVGLLVSNGNPGCCPGLLQMQNEEAKLPNGITAHLIRTPIKMYGGMTLWWEQEGTHIEISGPNLTEEELINIAASMSSTANLGKIAEGMPIYIPTQPAELPFDLLLPSWLPEEMARSVQMDGEIVTITFDPRPGDAPHSLLSLVEMPVALIGPGGDPDPQATQEQIGDVDVTVIRRGESCITFEWNVGNLYLQLTNPYDPPGQPRYTCDQLRSIIESIR